MKAPQDEQHHQRDDADEPVVIRRRFQIDPEQRGTGDAAKPVLAAGDLGPAKRHHIEHRGQCECQQREVYPAPSQDQVAERRRDRSNHNQPKQRRPDKRSRHQAALGDGRGIGRKPKPGAMAERHQSGMTDQDIERHAGQCENHDLGRGGHGEAHRQQNRRQHQHGCGGDDEGNRELVPHAHLLETHDAFAEQAARTEEQDEQHHQVDHRGRPLRQAEADGDALDQADHQSGDDHAPE